MSGSQSSVLCDVPLSNNQVHQLCAGPYTGEHTQNLTDYFLSNEPNRVKSRLASALNANDLALLPISANKEDRVRYWRRVAKYFISSGNNIGATNKYEPLEPFFVVDLGQIVAQFARFRANLPKVRPHYAVKCNPSLALMRVIASLGGGFDCASHKEIRMVLDNGLGTTKDIIFANPVKMPHELTAARRLNVNCVTFDSTQELEKLAQYLPDAQAVLRIKTNDGSARCAFSTKFGASLDDAPKLLRRAMELQVEVVGVSFHVGSGNNDPAAYTGSIRDARLVFDMAVELGMEPLKLLDLGGGFPGTAPPCDSNGTPLSLSFEEIAAAMRPVLDECFGDLDVEIIAEPGRYFSASSHMLAVNVFGARRVPLPAPERRTLRNILEGSDSTADSNHSSADEEEFAETEEYQYYVSDGLYNSFNCIVFDHAHPELRIVDEDEDEDVPNTTSATNPSNENEEEEERRAASKKTAKHNKGATYPAEEDVDVNDEPEEMMFCKSASQPQSLHVDVASSLSAPRTHLSKSPISKSTLPSARTQRNDQTVAVGRTERKQRPLRVTTIFGPTCDSMDCIVKKQVCPELVVGDWLFFPDMGSYTIAASCGFNGFETRRIQYICSLSLPEDVLSLLASNVASETVAPPQRSFAGIPSVRLSSSTMMEDAMYADSHTGSLSEPRTNRTLNNKLLMANNAYESDAEEESYMV